MFDIILVIFPFIIICVAMILFINSIKKKYNKNKEEDYMAIGISLGMCFGVSIGTFFMNTFGAWAISYGASFGMLGGMLIGMNIKKKD